MAVRASARRAARWLEARGLAYPGLRNPPADQSSAAAPDTEVCVPASALVVAGHMSATLRDGVMR